MERIKEQKAGYLAALPAVDKLFAEGNDQEDLPGLPNYLAPIVTYLEPLVIEQLKSTVEKYG
jgi:hypothetical protein